jgi:hypothetical protein
MIVSVLVQVYRYRSRDGKAKLARVGGQFLAGNAGL